MAKVTDWFTRIKLFSLISCHTAWALGTRSLATPHLLMGAHSNEFLRGVLVPPACSMEHLGIHTSMPTYPHFTHGPDKPRKYNIQRTGILLRETTSREECWKNTLLDNLKHVPTLRQRGTQLHTDHAQKQFY